MKIGLVARSENRGLGNLSFDWYEHMHPDRVLVVVPNHNAKQRLDRYPGATVVKWNHRRDGTLDEAIVKEWLRGLDVVYSAETFYDWRVCDWARELGVRTVCHVMPEYFRHGDHELPEPDAWWTPTSWRRATLRPATRLVPVPIAVERFAVNPLTCERPRWLHVAGVPASGDRNGTNVVRAAMRMLTREHTVSIRSTVPLPRPTADPHVRLLTSLRPVAEYWDLYHEMDALIYPRRYGGLSLPAREAMAAGLAVVMTDCEPQASEWPIIPLDSTIGGSVTVAGGTIPLHNVAPPVLAARMDWLADHPDELAAARRNSRAYAETQSWERLEPMIRAELERVCR